MRGKIAAEIKAAKEEWAAMREIKEQRRNQKKRYLRRLKKRAQECPKFRKEYHRLLRYEIARSLISAFISAGLMLLLAILYSVTIIAGLLVAISVIILLIYPFMLLI